MSRKKVESTSKYITTHDELKNFTSQVNSQTFPDQKFQKAYEKFKRPAYHQLVEQNNDLA